MEILIPLFIGTMVIGGFILWIWAIIDCATNEPSVGNDKLVWILIIVLAGWIGALIYLLVRRPKRIEQARFTENQDFQQMQ